MAELSSPTKQTLKRLFGLSGNCCAFPDCRVPVIAGETVLCEVCHIRGAKPTAARYDATQTPQERHGFENLLLLCPNHHTVIDDDEIAYTVERLIAMKSSREDQTTEIPDAQANDGAEKILSMFQMGGITAHTVNAQTINIHPLAEQRETDGKADGNLMVFAPELARLMAGQIYMLDRASVNFVCSAAGHPTPGDHWTTFRPGKPTLYPSVSEFRELTPSDAALLAEFYDKLNHITDLVTGWQESQMVWDTNAWNHLMQTIQHSVEVGMLAVHRFCPGRLFSATMPTAGTLEERAATSTSYMRDALAAHIRRRQERQKTTARR